MASLTISEATKKAKAIKETNQSIREKDPRLRMGPPILLVTVAKSRLFSMMKKYIKQLAKARQRDPREVKSGDLGRT